MKCILIGTTLMFAFRATKRKTARVEYLRSLVQGIIFGIGYSVYFTTKKVDDNILEQLLEGEDEPLKP